MRNQRRRHQAEGQTGRAADFYESAGDLVAADNAFEAALVADPRNGAAYVEMAKVAMEGFQEFMVKPDNLDRILAKLDRARERNSRQLAVAIGLAGRVTKEGSR